MRTSFTARIMARTMGSSVTLVRRLLFKLQLLLGGGNIRVRSGAIRFALHPGQAQLRRSLAEGWPPVMAKLVRLADADTLFLDIGADSGAATLLVAKHSGASVLAFEPDLRHFTALAENLLLNPGLNITPLNLALTTHPGFLTLAAPAAGRSLPPATKAQGQGAPQETRPLPRKEDLQLAASISLDELARLYLEAWKPGRLLIRIDAGRHELDVLHGSTQLLSSPLPMAVCTAFHSPEHLFEIKDFLSVYRLYPFEPALSPKLKVSPERGSSQAFFANEAWTDKAAT
jgi:FkbM family methyltransferase